MVKSNFKNNLINNVIGGVIGGLCVIFGQLAAKVFGHETDILLITVVAIVVMVVIIVCISFKKSK
jgi:hypothetical protein